MEKEADKFRQDFGISNSDPIRLKSLLMKLGVIALFRPLSSEFSGMAVKVGDLRFMLINSNHSVGRQHFSICHELYHLYVQEEFTPHHSKASAFNRSDKIEYSADLFATYLLMPHSAIISLIPNEELVKDKITLETILKIEHYFSCSRTALLYRLKEMNLISNSNFEEFKTGVIKSAKRYGYNDSLYMPGNEGLTIGNYGPLAKHLFDKEKISEGHYAELMSSIGFDILNNSDEDGRDRKH